MSKQDLDVINEEVRDPASANTDPKKTFAYKFLMVGVRIAAWWTAIVAFAIVAQTALVALQSSLELSVVEIPGLGGLFIAGGGVAGAVVGLDKLKDIRGKNSTGGGA
jgi:hypothetical protein